MSNTASTHHPQCVQNAHKISHETANAKGWSARAEHRYAINSISTSPARTCTLAVGASLRLLLLLDAVRRFKRSGSLCASERKGEKRAATALSFRIDADDAPLSMRVCALRGEEADSSLSPKTLCCYLTIQRIFYVAYACTCLRLPLK